MTSSLPTPPLGPLIPNTNPAPLPSLTHSLPGTHITLVPLSTSHTSDLYTSIAGPSPANTAVWTYLPDGPFPTLESFAANHVDMWVNAPRTPLQLYAIILHGSENEGNEGNEGRGKGKAVGHVALMRADPKNRVIEIGFVVFSPSLQKTRAATEVVYLLARHVFDELGYRRLEWKCNGLNEGSCRAAERLGFTYEGCFRQHMVVKGRNRDTSWYSMLDGEWDVCRRGFEGWLDDGNFDERGRQRRGLREIREGIKTKLKAKGEEGTEETSR